MDKLDFQKTVTLTMNAKKLARKQSRKRQKVLLFELFVDFAKNTTLHGLKYINERGLSIIEKVFWLITFLISVGLCFFLIRNVWIKWKTSPVLVTFSEQMEPVGKVPFPSVTICPQIKSQASKYNFSKKYEQFFSEDDLDYFNATTSTEIYKFEDVMLVCAAEDENWSAITDREMGNKSIIDHLIEVAPSVSDTFEKCVWRRKTYDCESLFKIVLTHEGICYNFNSLSADEIFNTYSIQRDYSYLQATNRTNGWSIYDGYSNDNLDPYPRRGRENGAQPDLDVVLKNEESDSDGVCNGVNHGYKIYVQNPADLPHASLYYYAALSQQVSSLALKFSMLTTSSNLKGYTPDVRQCYFPEDRQLQYFRTYTKDNCKLECIADFIFRRCRCVWYDMPHRDSEHICTFKQFNCVKDAKEEFADREMRESLGSEAQGCHCLPGCTSINYDAEILKTDFDFANYYKKLENIYNETDELNTYSAPKIHYSRIQMYFKESRFVSMRRSELFGVTDFFANCGGLLGLFLGFSFLSLVEIIYFITLRFCCILRRDMRANKSN